MLKIRQIECKAILNKSSLSDFTLNCYVGCTHRCLYCYARYMQGFKNRPQEWGNFVDVKVNATQALAKGLQKISLPKEVFMSSVCDGWQPLEVKYKLSRACLKLLLEAGADISILTKSSLILRDFDLLGAYKTGSLGITLTTMNPGLQKALEPYASTSQERLNTLKKAQNQGIETYVFLGPLIPEFTDTPANLEGIFRALKGLNLTKIYVDKLNPRWGVLGALKRGLSRGEFLKTRLMLYTCTNPRKYSAYASELRRKALEISCQFGLSDKVSLCF